MKYLAFTGKNFHRKILKQLFTGGFGFLFIRTALTDNDGILDSDCQCRKIEERRYFYFTTLVVTRDDVRD